MDIDSIRDRVFACLPETTVTHVMQYLAWSLAERLSDAIPDLPDPTEVSGTVSDAAGYSGVWAQSVTLGWDLPGGKISLTHRRGDGGRIHVAGVSPSGRKYAYVIDWDRTPLIWTFRRAMRFNSPVYIARVHPGDSAGPEGRPRQALGVFGGRPRPTMDGFEAAIAILFAARATRRRDHARRRVGA